MSKAIVDPNELRRFAEELKRFNGDMQNSMSSLQSRFSALSDTWQDHEHVKFAQDFQDTMKTLSSIHRKFESARAFPFA